MLNSQENTCALSQPREMRIEVTPGLLKKILKSTAKAKLIDPTHDLALRGTNNTTETVDSKRIKQLKSSCPSITCLSLQNLNLLPRNKARRPNLAHFPANIERLSLRNSKFEPKSLFASMNESSMEKLHVLDVGLADICRDREASPEAYWPKLENLKELYLEGVRLVDSRPFLEKVLPNFPDLLILDLEGTMLQEDDLVMLAKCAPTVRELYLGYTPITDSSIHQLVRSGTTFSNLEITCLAETKVGEAGIAALIRICPALQRITAKRARMLPQTLRYWKESRLFPGVTIELTLDTSIMAVFRDRGCNHYSRKHGSHEYAVAPFNY